MNEAFREYAFGRAFTIHLSEKQIEHLAALCKGDVVAAYGLTTANNGLLRRGLIEFDLSDLNQRRFRPTKAGLLVYGLLVEAGEYAALEEKRQKTIELEHELHQKEWEDRFGDVQVKLKERHLRDAGDRSNLQ